MEHTNETVPTRGEKCKAFLARKEINPSAKTYFVTAMGAMAMALFASLLMSTILGTLGDLIFGEFSTTDFLHIIEKYAFDATGLAIGAAIAYSLKAQPLVIFSATVVGSMANAMGATIDGAKFSAGPAGVFFVAIIATELGKVVSKETKVDILVTPLTVLLAGFGAAKLICPAVAYLMYWTAEFIGIATAFAPLLMGAVVAIVVGIVLTLPISSAALCASIFAKNVVNSSTNKEALLLAAGAACVGCCCQMVGFAAASFRENGVGGLVAQGLGTSMLQMPNIYRNPRIWLAPTLASAICGAMSTTLFKLQCIDVSAGMGTCGLVGPIGLFTTTYGLGGPAAVGAKFWIGTVLLCLVLPAALSIGFDLLFRRLGWVKDGDMKLDL